MDEREVLIQELKAELQWVKYRTRMLDIIEEKLLKMRKRAEIAIGAYFIVWVCSMIIFMFKKI